jgi:SAM-dependent methyltransferase
VRLATLKRLVIFAGTARLDLILSEFCSRFTVLRIASLIATGGFDPILFPFFARLKGLDLAEESLDELGLSSERSVRHKPSGGSYLARVLTHLEIPSGSRIVDFGSGKGGAVFTLAKFPFEEILGVELSKRLIRIAESNIEKTGVRNVHFVCCDAGRFRDLDRFTHVYMYNPFPRTVVKEVVQNLAASLARVPRTLTIIYYYPVCDDVIMESRLFERKKEITFQFSDPFYIYVHDASGPGAMMFS